MRLRWCSVSLLAALAPAACALQIELGVPWDQVLAAHGKPSREIMTDNGSLAFYGSLMVGVEHGIVRFLSRGLAVDGAAALVLKDARPGRPSPARSKSPGAAGRVVAAQPVVTRSWIEESHSAQAMILAERMRRCLALEVSGRILAQTSRSRYYDGRHSSYDGSSTFERCLHPSDNDRPAGVGDGVTLLDLRDSQSVRITGHGTEVAMHDRFVAVQQSLFSP